MNEILIHAIAWTHIKNILSERRKIQKITGSMVPFIGSSRTSKDHLW